MGFLTNAIRIAREKRRWTQKDLAQKLKVSQSAISFWENGVEFPSLIHQIQLIEVMPDILTALAIQELQVLERLQSLERTVFEGKCSCKGCSCSQETPVKAISRAKNE